MIDVERMVVSAVRAAKRAISLLRTRVPVTGAEWADNHFYLSPESSGTEGRWRCYPYQVAWLNWMTSDDIEEINLQKSRRVGYTKSLIAATAYLIEQKNRNIAIWHPTDGDASDFVTDEIDTMLRDVPAVGSMLRCAVGAKSKFNTVTKKTFAGAVLDVKGGKSARNFRRMTKDVAIYDETDGFDRDIDNEGSCFELGDGRLDQAPFPKSIRGSTPKTKGLSLIETAVDNSGMVFYRFVRCPTCGVLQRLEWSRMKWANNDPATVEYECLNSCRLAYRQYPDMDANGRWQTLDGTYYVDSEDQFYSAGNEKIPKPRRVGLRIWAGYSYLRPWSYIVDRWLEATKNAKAGNITTLKTVINTLLGETFEEEGDSVASDTLSSRGETYLSGGTIPHGILMITAGADVQGGANARIEAEIVGHGLDGETWSLDYIVIPGEAERPEVWDHLDEALKRRFVRDDGVELGISCAFIDSGYLATEVYRFAGPRRRRNIYATKGVNSGTLCNKGTWQGERKNRSRALLHTVNVDDAKTIIFGRLRVDVPGPGYCHFPAHYTPDHYEKLTNEEKREKRKAGTLVGYEWVKIGPNEPLDCRAYALGALARINPNMQALKTRLEKQAGAGTKEVDPEPTEKQKQPRRQGRPRRGFVQSWK